MGTRIRRARGESAGTVGLFVEVAPDVKAAIDRWATLGDVPLWAVVEAMVHELDQHGRPEWWPRAAGQQEELPLGKTA